MDTISNNDKMHDEILLSPVMNRYVIYPIKYPDIWSFYKRQQTAFWTVEEIDFSGDKEDWKCLSENEKKIIQNILAFFASSDGIVFENISINFCEEIQIPEVRVCYGFQGMMENIHGECYSLMIDTFIEDENTKNNLLNSITKMPIIKKKSDWVLKYMNKDIDFAVRLVAFSIVEGIFFSGSFCVIFWLKYIKNKMKHALAKSNELISRDESLHTEFAVHLYTRYIKNKLSSEQIYNIIREAVDIEIEFICDSLECEVIGINKISMEAYIKYVADRLLYQLGYKKLYHEKCPYDFMTSISIDGKSNFFEQRVTEYNRSEQLNPGGLVHGDIKIMDDF